MIQSLFSVRFEKKVDRLTENGKIEKQKARLPFCILITVGPKFLFCKGWL